MSEIMICPIFGQPCLRDRCVGFYSYTKEVFKDLQLNKFIPIQDLAYYRTLPQEYLDQYFNRIVSITRECRLLGVLIEKEEVVDHLVPNPTQNHYT
jgi:hypothetical protein